jgi:hypothetical protein
MIASRMTAIVFLLCESYVLELFASECVLTVGRWTTAGDDPEGGYSPSHHHHHHHLFPEWKRERDGGRIAMGGWEDVLIHVVISPASPTAFAL